jgi:hypothetical protein
VCDAEDFHPTNDYPLSLFRAFDSVMWWFVNPFVTLVGLWCCPLHVVFCSVYFVILWDCQDCRNVGFQIKMVISGCEISYEQMASWWLTLRKIHQWLLTCVMLCRFLHNFICRRGFSVEKFLLPCYLGTKYLAWTTQLDTLCNLLKCWAAVFSSSKVIVILCFGQVNISLLKDTGR